MYEMISTKDMSHTQWLKMRKTGIGGSDAGAICGLNPYASVMSVFYDKITEEPGAEDNEAMRQGRELEDYVAKRFCEASALKVRGCGPSHCRPGCGVGVQDSQRL